VLARDVPPTVPLTTDGRIFLQAGQPWRWKGVSAFQLLDRWAHGEDIEPFLRAYKGFNVLRVWLYTPRKEWGDSAWDAPGAPTVRAFLDRVALDGWYVELTLLTDDDPARLPSARALVADLAQAPRPSNLLLEIGNEPRTHKAIDTRAMKAALDASGFLYASGDYEESARAFGSYLVTHTGRDSEWPRRAHDLLEFYTGGGPNDPSDPAHRVPIVADEPAKLQDVGGDRVNDWRAYFGTVALLGAGGTFHAETGKFARLPTPEESALAAAALEGLNAFPADAPRGGYARLVESIAANLRRRAVHGAGPAADGDGAGGGLDGDRRRGCAVENGSAAECWICGARVARWRRPYVVLGVDGRGLAAWSHFRCWFRARAPLVSGE
jgi:hypothetical protein